MTKKAVTLEIPELIQFLVQELHDLPDDRKPGNNTKYQVEDAVKAAFSVFFTQSPSFLEHQRLMKSSKGKDNASSLFGIKKIPGDHQIRNRLAPIPAATIFGSFQQVYQGLKKQGVIKKFFSLDEEILIALDGTEYFSSKKTIDYFYSMENEWINPKTSKDQTLERRWNLIKNCIKISQIETLGIPRTAIKTWEKTGKISPVHKKIMYNLFDLND
jgi:hypothetical protein